MYHKGNSILTQVDNEGPQSWAMQDLHDSMGDMEPWEFLATPWA